MFKIDKIKLSFFKEINPYYIVIKHDYYRISERIKAVDSSLFLVYNMLQQQYEVHDIRTKDNTFVLRFDDIDKDIINLLNKVKDRNTIAYSRKETRNRMRYNSQKQKVRKEHNKDFINRDQLEIITR